MTKSKLKDLELFWDPDRKEYYLKAKYEVEDDYRITEHIFPHIVFPITDEFVAEGSDVIHCGYGAMRRRSGKVYIPGTDGKTIESSHIIRIIEEKPQEMTVEEIEKKLGYKIKIVGDKHE